MITQLRFLTVLRDEFQNFRSLPGEIEQRDERPSFHTITSSALSTPGRAPATQQQFVSACLPHTIFTLYKKISAATGMGPSFSRSGCVSRSALERVCFLAISTSAKGLWGDERHARLRVRHPGSDACLLRRSQDTSKEEAEHIPQTGRSNVASLH